MNFDATRLYELLPALYRLRDAEVGRALDLPGEGGPLRALLAVLAEQVGVLEEDLDQLYDDQFIETCAEWVVPYLGDLVGARGLVVFPGADFSQRGQVANTLGYRRRKGTAAVVEQLARDVTGWDASVVEYFQLLATTQYLNHLRPDNLATAPVGSAARLAGLHTPFDTVTRTADVRRIEPRRGQYNLPNIGVYLWRLGSYPLTQSDAFRVDDRRFTFNALGFDAPLYNRPAAEEEITHLAGPANVPRPLGRAELAQGLAQHYGPGAAGQPPPALLVWADGQPVGPGNGPGAPLLADLVTVCDLRNVQDLAGHDVLDGAGQPVGWVNMPATKLAIDPVLGRLAFPAAQPPPGAVQVSYQYGFGARMGGGEYGRASTFTADLAPLVAVSKANGVTIQQALDQLAGTGGVVEIRDNGSYLETPAVRIPAGKTIELRAADEHRPVLALAGPLVVVGDANAEFVLNGLLVSGGPVWAPAFGSPGQPNLLRAVRVRHCTLLPGPSPAVATATGSVPAQPAGPRLVVEVPGCEAEVFRSIVGSLRVSDEATAHLTDSLVDALGPAEVAYAGLLGPGPATAFAAVPGGVLTVENCTVVGKVHARALALASNTLFLARLGPADAWPAPVLADRLQQGCVRFSYLPPGARVPAPHRCQPQAPADAARVRPTFTSLRYGAAGYGQLSARCAPEISEGADDGAEMGAFHHLYQPQRAANLRARLEEYLRFGLEAGIFWGS